MIQDDIHYETAAREAIDLGNRLANADEDADLWDIADGLLAGAIQYWLYSRQPCGDPTCEDCAPISSASQRLAELQALTKQLAEESEYFHTPNDSDVGRA
ncbi:MAG: hypothetical protein Kow006_28000 [Gammaproteobacteria bacterium]